MEVTSSTVQVLLAGNKLRNFAAHVDEICKRVCLI
jgi:hypothetical protein